MALAGHSSPYASNHEPDEEVPTPAGEAAFDDSESGEEWEEIDVGADNSAAALAAATAAAGNKELSITIATAGKGKGKKKKPDGSITRDRTIRQQRHKAHASCHLALGLIRNRLINNQELQALLLSKVPLHLQNAFFVFSKQTHPQEWERVRLFDDALKKLLDWWYDNFRIEDEKGLKRRDPAEVEKELALWAEFGDASGGRRFPWEAPTDFNTEEERQSAQKRKTKGKGKEREWGPSEDTWERLGPGDMQRRIQKLKGSRDLSAQLFTCLCRALDIPSRLVFSFQPIDWRAPSALAKKTNKKTRGKGGQTTDGGTTDSDAGSKKGRRSAATSGRDSGAESWQDGQGKLNYTVPKVNLRRTKKVIKDYNRSPSPDPGESTRPPVFWTEVWSRYQRKWISVDPYRRKYRCKDTMEPPRSMSENQLLYAVAFEEDGSARDVTPRYVKSFTNYTAKMRAPSKKNTDWFAALLMPFSRTFELNRDREEQKELWDSVRNEPFPTSLGGFKGHPNYVLEQHLHRDEMIRPHTKQLGLFKGTEAVFPRSAVVTVKSKENYWRVGRVIRDNVIPMKWVKARTVTINKKRAENLAMMDGEAPDEQPLYAEEQTELYVPPPVVDGKIPKNDFGNIDLYVPSMLPEGAVHLQSKQAAKCAKALGVDYAEAITGFEFRQRRANPVMTGIVVAAEMADTLMGAIIEMEQAAEEKEFVKLQQRCLKRWKTLILGLRIRQRVNASYSNTGKDKSAAPSKSGKSQFRGNGKSGKRAAPSTEEETADDSASSSEKEEEEEERAAPPPRKRKATTAAKIAVATPTTASSASEADTKVSTTGRSLRLRMSPSKSTSAAETRGSSAAAVKTRAQAADEQNGASTKVSQPARQSGSESGDSLVYESDF